MKKAKMETERNDDPSTAEPEPTTTDTPPVVETPETPPDPAEIEPEPPAPARVRPTPIHPHSGYPATAHSPVHRTKE